MTLTQDSSGSDQNSTTPRPPRRSFSTARLARLCLKELRETLRDRRTIVTLVFMPLLVYPLLSMAFHRFALSSYESLSLVEYHIGVETEAAQYRLLRFLDTGNTVLGLPLLAQPRDELASSEPGATLPEPGVQIMPLDNLRGRVISGNLDVAVIMLNEDRAPPGSPNVLPLKCELLYREESALSKGAAEYIQKRFRAINENFIQNSLRVALPTDVQLRSLEGSGAAFSLTTLVPLILILMTITGAVYPAIDLTAGERERGTLETLMAAPVPRLRLLLAKYVAVLIVALFTATMNLFAMTVTLTATGLSKTVFGEAGLTSATIAQVFALLILFAAFFSAILLAVTSFARSFKEAQAYLIPLMLLSLAPGMMSLMPDLDFNGVLSVIPLVNMVLLAREIFEGDVNPTLATAAVVSTGIYAFAAISLAARIFGTDAILYGSQATWEDLFRRSPQLRQVATIPGAMICLAALFPGYFLLSNALHQLPDTGIGTKLVLSAVVTAVLFVLLPVLVARFQRLRLRTAFQLQGAHPLGFAAAFVLGVSVWPFAHEIYLVNEALGISSLNLDRIKIVEQLLASWRQLSPALILVTLALAPAVCEEFFFRGYLMGAMRKAMNPWLAIVGSALFFGIFHVLATSALSTERLLPSTFMGLFLGWICYRTGSVLPGMLLHACHNGLLLMIAYYRDELLARGLGIQEQQHLPAVWLVAAAAGVAIGAGLLVAGTRRERSPAAEVA